jgi:hypothetical protein
VSCRTRRGRPCGRNRKQLFNQINGFVISRNGWVTSVPGWAEVTLETLWGSLPDELCQLGYDVQQIGEG